MIHWSDYSHIRYLAPLGIGTDDISIGSILSTPNGFPCEPVVRLKPDLVIGVSEKIHVQIHCAYRQPIKYFVY